MLATLRTYQDRVLAIAGEAERLLAAGDAARLPRIVQLRAEQGGAMAAYQLFVHREIFAPMMRDGVPAEMEAAKELKVACIAFSNALCHHMQEWSRRDPAADWGDYRVAALRIIVDLRAHVAHVREMMAPALGRREAEAALGVAAAY